MNSLLFNPTQKKMLDHTVKPNIFRFEDLKMYGLYKHKDENADCKEIVEYYAAKLNEKDFDKFDQKIVQILPERVRKLIEKDSQ